MRRRVHRHIEILPLSRPHRRRRMAVLRQTSFTSPMRIRSRFSVKSSTIASGRLMDFPPSFAETSDGQVLIANGLQPMLIWNGRSYQAFEAGVPAPTTAVTMTASGTGTITGTYTAFLRYLDADGNPSNLSPISDALTATDNLTITYTNVQGTDDARIVTRQILRNTTGQGNRYFVDVETNDLGLTTFASTRTDDDLGGQEEVDLFANEVDLANRFGVPPNWKAFIANHKDRIFAVGEHSYTRGNASVTIGSATVTGVGTQWQTAFVGRNLYVVGADRAYAVEAVDVAAQTLTLSEPYRSITDPFALYAIRPPPTEARLMYWSESGLSQAWPLTNSLALANDGDVVTGLFNEGSWLYIAEQEHLYHTTFSTDPVVDGKIWLTAGRGLVNHRCVVQAGAMSFLMDRRGVYGMADGEVTDGVSDQVQDLFRSDGDVRINWTAKELFHACHYPSQETVRFFVTLSGTRFPQHALCYQYTLKRWSIEAYTQPIGASAVVYMDRARYVLGSAGAKVFLPDSGTLDNVDPEQGTVRGTVTGATALTLADTAATFAGSSLVGASITMVSGRGKGQTRTILGVSGTTISLVEPWLVLPAVGDTYQIGGVAWQWRSGWLRHLRVEQTNPQGTALEFEPLADPASMDVRRYFDHATEPADLAYTNSQDGVATTAGDPDTVVDLTIPNGYARVHRDHGIEQRQNRPDIVSIELRGVTNLQLPRVFQISVWGVEGRGN